MCGKTIRIKNSKEENFYVTKKDNIKSSSGNKSCCEDNSGEDRRI